MTRLRGTTILLLLFLLIGCAPARPPVPPGVIPEPRAPSVEDEQYGHQVLNQLLERYRLEYNNPALPRITEIVERLAKAAGADKSPWHVYLLKDDQFVNAGATRGNHVFVWTGLLTVAKTDEELATILSHEISHVLSGHTDPDPNEELRRLLINLGSVAAGVAVAGVTRDPYLGQNLGSLTSSVTNEVGSGLFVNPYSQELELEADRVGLLVMAEARYDPEAAVNFWDKAQNDLRFNSTTPFFSTHPPAADRLEALRKLLPDAEARYHGERPSTPAARGDSFDFRAQSAASPRSSPPPSAALERCEVTGDKALLYRSPTPRSTAIGEFRRGAVVDIVSRTGSWFEISKPEHGFLRRQDCLELSGVPRRSEWAW